MNNIDSLFKSIETDFIKAKDISKIEKMKSYMRGQFEFYGIYTPVRISIFKKYKSELNELDWVLVKKLVIIMWDQPQREFQHFAQDILDLFPGKYDEEDWEFLEKLIKYKPWWDTVDFLSSHQFRDYSLVYPEKSKWVVDRWLNSEDIWLQRSCLLYQLWYKENTDLKILEKAIQKLKQSDEFFIQKAIGWILREYSKTNPQWVREFIKNIYLKPLSIREGSKYLK